MGKTDQTFIGMRVSSGVLDQVENVLKDVNLAKTIERPHFRVADTSLTYRRISNLKENGLLPDHSQESDRSWSKFSIKDYVYLLAIADLRSFGVNTKQIQKIKNLFYGTESNGSTRALCAIFGHIEISLLCYANGDIFLCDADGAAYLEAESRAYEPFIKISINKHMNHVLSLAGVPHKFDVRETAADRHLRLDLQSLTLKEIETLGIIRNQDYKEIVITKQDNDLDRVTGTEYLDPATLSKSELFHLLDGFEYGQAQITKKDGRTVYVKRENSIKL